jgi:peptidoglycan hydrolase-like protein with peptidoglycan-binding domain
MSSHKIRTLQKGMIGEDVRAVQKALNARLPLETKLVPDGQFGKFTHDAVIALQQKTGCKPTGVVDAEFRSVLFPLVTATTTVSLLRMRSADSEARA